MKWFNKRNNELNGKALTEKVKTITELNVALIENLDSGKKEILLEKQSEILNDYLEKSIERERWHKFFMLMKSLIYLGTFLAMGILVIFILNSTGALVLDGMIKDLLTGVLSTLTGLLGTTFLGLLGFLGLKKG